MAPPNVLPRFVELETLTTLGVGGPAELWEVENEADLLIATHEPYRVIGAGSNLLVADAGVPERVVKLGRAYNSLREFDLESGRGKSDVWLGAATPLPGLVRRAAEAGLSGLEGLLGVPAVLGGAVAMNAGTRFGEMSDTLQEVEIFVGGKTERLNADALGLGYRRSALPPGAILTRVRLLLTPSTKERVTARLAQVDAARKGFNPNVSRRAAPLRIRLVNLRGVLSTFTASRAYAWAGRWCLTSTATSSSTRAGRPRATWSNF